MNKELLFEIMPIDYYGNEYCQRSVKSKQISNAVDVIFKEIVRHSFNDEIDNKNTNRIKAYNHLSIKITEQEGDEIIESIEPKIEAFRKSKTQKINYLEYYYNYNNTHGIFNFLIYNFGQGNITYIQPKQTFWQRLKNLNFKF